MTAPHDTPEAVEAMGRTLEHWVKLPDAAAMLRRLHAAKVEAERERDAWKLQSNDWQKRGWELGSKLDAAEAALATARADALREAAEWHSNRAVKERASGSISGAMAEEYAATEILALIPKQEKPHD